MALILEKCTLRGVKEYPFADGVEAIREGQWVSFRRANGRRRVKPLDAGEKPGGMAVSAPGQLADIPAIVSIVPTYDEEDTTVAEVRASVFVRDTDDQADKGVALTLPESLERTDNNNEADLTGNAGNSIDLEIDDGPDDTPDQNAYVDIESSGGTIGLRLTLPDTVRETEGAGAGGQPDTSVENGNALTLQIDDGPDDVAAQDATFDVDLGSGEGIRVTVNHPNYRNADGNTVRNVLSLATGGASSSVAFDATLGRVNWVVAAGWEVSEIVSAVNAVAGLSAATFGSPDNDDTPFDDRSFNELFGQTNADRTFSGGVDEAEYVTTYTFDGTAIVISLANDLTFENIRDFWLNNANFGGTVEILNQGATSDADALDMDIASDNLGTEHDFDNGASAATASHSHTFDGSVIAVALANGDHSMNALTTYWLATIGGGVGISGNSDIDDGGDDILATIVDGSALDFSGGADETTTTASVMQNRTGKLPDMPPGTEVVDGTVKVYTVEDGSVTARDSGVDVDDDGSYEVGDTLAQDTDIDEYLFHLRRTPSNNEVMEIQGNPEPGTAHVTQARRSTGVVTAGEMYTTEWETESELEMFGESGHAVRLADDGRIAFDDDGNKDPITDHGIELLKLPEDGDYPVPHVGVRFNLD